MPIACRPSTLHEQLFVCMCTSVNKEFSVSKHCLKFAWISQGLFPPGQGATIGVDFMIKSLEIDNDRVKVGWLQIWLLWTLCSFCLKWFAFQFDLVVLHLTIKPAVIKIAVYWHCSCIKIMQISTDALHNHVTIKYEQGPVM
jgi:hypothetical protein